MPAKKFTFSEDAEIAKIYTIGVHSSRQIAIAYGCRGATISAALKRQGIDTSKRYVRVNLYHFNEHAFDKIDDEQSAYWLGFLFADGHLRKAKKQKAHSLTITLSIKDKEHLLKFNTFLESDYIIRECNKKYQYGSRKVAELTITGQDFGKRLHNLGLINKDIKLTMNEIDKSVIHHFIRGFFDGDGCIAKNRIEIIFCGTDEITKWIRIIFHETLGTNIEQKLVKNSRSTIIKYLTYGGRNQAKMIYDWMYKDATVYLPRKKLIFDSHFAGERSP